MQQLWKDPAAKIEEFADAFNKLRDDLGMGTLQQTVIITSKISGDVQVLGTLIALLPYHLA